MKYIHSHKINQVLVEDKSINLIDLKPINLLKTNFIIKKKKIVYLLVSYLFVKEKIGFLFHFFF